MEIRITDLTSTVAMRHIGKMLTALSAEIEGLDGSCVADSEMLAADLPIIHRGLPAAPPEQPSLPAPPEQPSLPAAPPAPPAGTELDSAGIPWDNRIHAAARTKCKDGSWKLRPGVDKAVVDQVIAELKGVQSAPVMPPAAPPAPPAPPAAATDDTPASFAALLQRIAPHFIPPNGTAPQPHQTLTADMVNGICASHGVPMFNLLAGRPDLIPQIWSEIKVLLP